MTDKQRETVHRINNFYGHETEISKVNEELGELITAVARGDVDNIAEEIADVSICMEHLAYMYGIERAEIDTIIDYKLNRQLGRMGE